MSTAETLVELCAIRDGLRYALSYLDACKLINLISLDLYPYLLLLRIKIHFLYLSMSVNSYIANVYCLPVYPDV